MSLTKKFTNAFLFSSTHLSPVFNHFMSLTSILIFLFSPATEAGENLHLSEISKNEFQKSYNEFGAVYSANSNSSSRRRLKLSPPKTCTGYAPQDLSEYISQKQQGQGCIATESELHNQRMIRIQYNRIGEMPLAIRNLIPNNVEIDPEKPVDFLFSLGQGQILDPDAPVDVSFKLENDNTELFSFGLLQKPDEGDDYGLTHAASFSIGTELYENPYFKNISFDYGTTLFAKKVSGPSHVNSNGELEVPQVFTNENITRIILDNIDPHKMQYYKVGIGWIEIDHRDASNFLNGSGQQKWLHHTVNKISGDNRVRIPVDRTDDQSNQDQILVELYTGIQNSIRLGKTRFAVEGGGEVGARYTPITDRRFAQGKGWTAIKFGPVSDTTLKTKAMRTIQQFDQGKRTTDNLEFSVARPSWQLGGGVERTKGAKLDAYDIPNIRNPNKRDPIYYIWINKQI